MIGQIRAVTFDYGQTLAELDTVLLARRVGERGAEVEVARLDAACPAAWDAYGTAKHGGLEGFEAWRAFMKTLLERAGTRSHTGAREDLASALVDFLWSEQPRRNLWRRPIPGMLELLEDLGRSGVPLGIVSNSEGRLVELLDEIGLRAHFAVVADSGKLGFEKPDRRIFELAAGGLGVATSELVHVGDAWEADVEGALAAGARAVWFTADTHERTLPARVRACRSALEVRSALRAWGVPA